MMDKVLYLIESSDGCAHWSTVDVAVTEFEALQMAKDAWLNCDEPVEYTRIRIVRYVPETVREINFNGGIIDDVEALVRKLFDEKSESEKAMDKLPF